MKLEVGMYVRVKSGEIHKIKSVANEYVEYENGFGVPFDLKDIIKASFNITDILEVGDIVIIEDFVDEACMIFKDMYYLQNEQQLFNLKNDLARNKNKKISRILTKEQFEQMSYKI